MEALAAEGFGGGLFAAVAGAVEVGGDGVGFIEEAAEFEEVGLGSGALIEEQRLWVVRQHDEGASISELAEEVGVAQDDLQVAGAGEWLGGSVGASGCLRGDGG